MKPARSITEHTYRQIKAELLRCKLKPGARLRTNELSARFNVSLSGIREALSRLSAEGLVEADPQRGFRATPLSPRDLSDLVEAAIAIDSICIRQSVARGDEAWEQRVRKAGDKVIASAMKLVGAGGQLNRQFLADHHDFHQALISACDNPWMLKMRDTCNLQAERYRQLCVPRGPELDEINAGYVEITEAALLRNADKAVELMILQFRRNARRFLDALQEDADHMAFWGDQEEEESVEEADGAF